MPKQSKESITKDQRQNAKEEFLVMDHCLRADIEANEKQRKKLKHKKLRSK